MILEHSITIDALAQAIWDFLLDVERSAACVPGVEEVTMIDDRTFDGVILARVGPISGTFSFRAEIVDSNPPSQLKAEVVGTDSVTKSTLKMDVSMTLTPIDPTSTTLSHRAVVDSRGRLACW